MPVLRRRIHASQFNETLALGAVQRDGYVLAAFAKDADKHALQGLTLIDVGRGFLACLPDGALDAPESELALFENRRVLIALRNGETAQAAADWVQYHSTSFNVDGVLIFNRSMPDGDRFAHDLADILGEGDCTVLVVDADTPLGRKGAPDARDSALAPAIRNQISKSSIDPWHAPLAELALYELLRHRFLASAQAVAFLDISDFLLPGKDSAFEWAERGAGQLVPLIGTEVYPWRLRQGQPAYFKDHIAKRRSETRKLLSWCAALSGLPDDCIWHPGRPLGGAFETTEIPFVRAMGVVFPGAPIECIVTKADLIEVAELAALANKSRQKPIRLPPAAVIPARPKVGTITIVSAMKNEGPFILDWVAHNRAIGVDRFLIYTNDCEDGTDRLLDLLDAVGVVRRQNSYRETGQVPQYAAFRAAESEDAVTSADWLLSLDVDEYINIYAGDGTVQDLLDAVPDAHVISMPWRLFGNADRHKFEDKPVTEQFTSTAPAFMPRPYQAWAFKSLFRNAGLFRRLGVHRPKGVQSAYQDTISWVNGSGKELPRDVWRSAWRVGTANWGYDLVTLNHYAVRSAESFLIKRERGRGNHVHEAQDEAYWFRMNHNVEEDKSIQRLANRTASVKAELLSLPGVANAHSHAVAWHQSRIAELKADPETSDFYKQITSTRMQKLSRYGPHFGMKVFMEGPHVVPDEIFDRDSMDNFYFTPKL